VLLPAIEIGVGIVLIVLLATVGRTLIGGCLTAMLGAAISFFSLLRVDAAATCTAARARPGKIGLAHCRPCCSPLGAAASMADSSPRGSGNRRPTRVADCLPASIAG
jgi:hypothetical protein